MWSGSFVALGTAGTSVEGAGASSFKPLTFTNAPLAVPFDAFGSRVGDSALERMICPLARHGSRL